MNIKEQQEAWARFEDSLNRFNNHLQQFIIDARQFSKTMDDAKKATEKYWPKDEEGAG